MSVADVTQAASAIPERVRIDSRKRWFPELRSVVNARELIVLLSRRNITVLYRQTILGLVWVVVSPLISALLFTFVFGHVAKLQSEGVPYFAFSYAGLLGWNLFSDTLTSSSKSFMSNTNLVTKIYFPRLVLPLSTVAAALVNALVTFAIMLVLLAVYHIGITLNVLLLPVWLVLSLILALAIGLVLTSISVLFRDVNYVAPFFVSLLLYLTPVAYSADEVPHDVRTLYLLNPMAPIVEGCRWSLLGHGSLTVWTIFYSVGVVIAAAVASLMIFARLEGRFADVI